MGTEILESKERFETPARPSGLDAFKHLRDDDILVLTEQHWDAPKRVAHKMPIAWAEAGNRVLWIEGAPFPIQDWRRRGQLRRSLRGCLMQPHERLWVGSAPPALPWMHKGGVRGNWLRAWHRPAMVLRLRRYLKQLGMAPKLVVLMQLAVRHDLLDAFPRATSVYYCHDLFGYGAATKPAFDEEAECCRRVDQVWATSEIQRQRLAAFNSRTYLMPHAVDERWWDHHCNERPTEYSSIGRPRIVFTGVVQTEKIDLELLIEAARLRPNVSFVFVGPHQIRPAEEALMRRARQAKNLHWLGERRVEQLPGYIAGADVLMLPYRLDDPNTPYIGQSLKFFEYMISGKPVIVTPYTRFAADVQDLITIAEGAAAWAEALDTTVTDRDPGVAARREALARRNTYRQRINQQRALLDGTA